MLGTPKLFTLMNCCWLQVFLRPHFIYIFFFLFRAIGVAYGGSEASGRIGATAAGYATATAIPDP